MDYISREESLKQLAFITKKIEVASVQDERYDSYEDIDNNKKKIVDDACEIASNNSESTSEQNTTTTTSIEELQIVFGGSIVNKYLMSTRQMTRKEYNQYTKGLDQEKLLDHPLLYAMFRAENQAQVNFLEWIGRFNK